MNEGAKKILRDYYLAYRRANGPDRTRRLRFSYKWGWVRFGGVHSYGPCYRLPHMVEYTRNLNARPAYEEGSE